MARKAPSIDDYVPPGSPTHGGVPVAQSRQRTRLGIRRRWRARVTPVITPIWDPHPVSVAHAADLADIYGRGINGQRGTISTGNSRGFGGAVGDPSVGWAGYTAPPQLFTGWNPAYQKHVGTPLRDPSGLPSTSVPLGSASPLDSAMLAINAGNI